MSAADVQETAQALFCAIVDTNKELLSANSILTKKSYKEFKAAFETENKKILTIFKNKVKPKATFKQVEDLLEDNSWFISSKEIAIELFKQIESVAGVNVDIKWDDIFYYHAKSDPNGIKTIINKLFSTANGLLSFNKFPSIDRWSPADIYFSTKSGIKDLKKLEKDNLPFNLLNPILIGMIQKGILIPISLKKNPGGGVTIKSVNFDRTKEVAEIKKYGYYGVLRNVKVVVGTREKDSSKYMAIKILEDSNEEFLNFRFSGTTFKVEIVIGEEVRGGSLSGADVIKRIFTKVDSNFSNKLFNSTDGIITEFKKSKNPDKSRIAADRFKKEFEDLAKNRKKASIIIRKLIESAGSRGAKSAPYIIAK